MPLTTPDLDLVQEGVDGLLDAYWNADCESLEILGVEQEFLYRDQAGVAQKGFIDIWGRDPKLGTWFIADWKSSDAQWVGQKAERQKNSKQPWDYALALVNLGLIPRDFGTIFGQYRCWSWSTARNKTMPFRLDSQDLLKHEEESLRWSRAREAYKASFGMYDWPKNDGGCRKYGPRYPCRLESVCWHVGEKEKPHIPVEALDKAGSWPLSYSSRETLKRCPELYRTEQVEKALDQRPEGDDDRASEMGSALHEALAEQWQQLILEER